MYKRLTEVKFDQDVALSLPLLSNLKRDYKNYTVEKNGSLGVIGVAVYVFTP
jgi:hypothetical protein